MDAAVARGNRIQVSATIKDGILYRQASVAAAPAGEVLWVATFLPVRRWRDVIAFIRGSSRVEEQLQRTAGLIGYGVRADLLHKRFWTLSAWTNRDAVNGFVRTDPHRSVVARFAEWAGVGAAFVEWRGAAKELDWEDALARLKNPTFSYNAGR